MVKKFSVPCDFNGQKIPVNLYIGNPHPDYHPLHFQSNWLSLVKGGRIPQDIMESIEKLRKLSVKHNVSFEELCFYAINVANGTIEDGSTNQEFAKIVDEM